MAAKQEAPVPTGPVALLATNIGALFGHAYLQIGVAEPEMYVLHRVEGAPDVHLGRSVSVPQACIPKKLPVAGKTRGEVLLRSENPVEGFDNEPLEVEVIEYPFAPLVATVNNCAEMLFNFVVIAGTIERLPRPTSVAVASPPEFVVST